MVDGLGFNGLGLGPQPSRGRTAHAAYAWPAEATTAP